MIDPKFAVTGQNLTIIGEDFGDEQGESFIVIGGVSPTLSSYIEWSDTKIVVRTPDFGESGLIYVHRNNQKSNPVLFSTLGSMPEFPESRLSYTPVIRQVRPAAAAIGRLIVIQGSGFGPAREESSVFFSWAAEQQYSVPAEVSPAPLIESHWFINAYEVWNEHEIQVRVCDGAGSGVLQVATPRGKSNMVPFEVSAKPGVKIIKDKRTYSIAYSVDVQVEKAEPPNSMYLWCPIPASNSYQLKKETIAGSSKPFVDNYRGAALYRLNDLKTGDGRRISVSYLIDVYGVETQIQANLVGAYSDSPIFRNWTRSSFFVHSDDAMVKETAARFIGKEQNPYLKAYSIYRNFLDEFTVLAGKEETSIEQALIDKEAGPYTAVMLFCALYRAAGIPAIPVSGILCVKAGSVAPHYWVEFWIDDFGWVPVDIVLGAGVSYESFKLRDDHESYYFGNKDNQHLVFSYGESSISQVDAHGRTASREPAYALQNIWEEASNGIEAYSTHWSDVNITGFYSN